MKYLRKFEEFTYKSPETKPITTPTKPGTKPGTKPRPHDPIRRDKPSVEPAPKAEAEDVVDRFIDDLKDLKNKPVENFDLNKLKERYKNKK